MAVTLSYLRYSLTTSLQKYSMTMPLNYIVFKDKHYAK